MTYSSYSLSCLLLLTYELIIGVAQVYGQKLDDPVTVKIDSNVFPLTVIVYSLLPTGCVVFDDRVFGIADEAVLRKGGAVLLRET